MMRHKMLGALALLAIAGAAMPSLSADFGVTPKPKGLQAITKPSKDIVVSFVRPGRIVDMVVSKGDEVKTGQLIAQLDDREERAALARDKRVAEDDTEIKAEEVIHEQKVRDVEKMKLYSGSVTEIENAILEEKVEAARLQIAKVKREDAALKLAETTIVVEKLKLVAPISGTVAEEYLKAGESADGGNMKAVRIVQLDPLWAEVPVPYLQAIKFNKGDPVLATFSDGKERAGNVVVVSPVGDAASETILVRVAIPNPEKKPSGENIFVNFPSPAVAGARP
jgi:RND family efflux transporter MFP subunit